MYFRPETGERFQHHADIRKAMLHVLFSDVIDDEMLAFHGVFPLAQRIPSLAQHQLATPADPQLIDGSWTESWEIRDASAEELVEMNEQAAYALEDARRACAANINIWRAGANSTLFTHAGKHVACDSLSRSDLDGVANHIALSGALPDGFPGAWKAIDNTLIPLPDTDAFRAMYASMTAQGTANFNHSQDLKARLAAATTSEEIAAIVW